MIPGVLYPGLDKIFKGGVTFMAKEKRTTKAQEELEKMTSSCADDCPDTCSSVSDDCGSMSADCQ